MVKAFIWDAEGSRVLTTCHGPTSSGRCPKSLFVSGILSVDPSRPTKGLVTKGCPISFLVGT